ncbi:MAG: hypothetical protein AB1644_03065 [Candidatus Zixiibacteriota bacterium]
MTRHPRAIVTISLLVAAALSAAASPSQATNFVSLNGKFYISYPADWKQVDFLTVDYFLAQSNAGQQTFQYEAVFAPADQVPFSDGPYLILTVDTIGNLTDRQIDSVLDDLSKGFGAPINRTTSGDPLTGLTVAEPRYDASAHLVTILSDIRELNQPLRKSLLAVKFYPGGTANFYFYAPDSLFARVTPVFRDILASFSTENIQAAMPKEELRLADSKKTSDTSDGSSTKRRGLFGGGIFVVIILIIVMARRRRKRREAEQNLQH